ncbi:MAG: ribonuclease III [Clostridiales bacterium]|nr:ribonuclease III [Clostridiales bacterium]
MDYTVFEEKLGYTFKDKALLELSLTHTTYVFEHNGKHSDSNQRLEYIGDAVMDLVIGRKLYELKPEADEGYLSKIRSIIVCEESFAGVARRLGIGELLLMGKGEEQTGGRDKDSTLADAFEALIAAVYFDSDFETVREVVLRNLAETIKLAVDGKIFLDYKSRLLEIAQIRNHQHKITFNIVDERGPQHEREFEVEVYADDTFLARAIGRSKKDAEQKGAKAAIEAYEKIFVVK